MSLCWRILLIKDGQDRGEMTAKKSLQLVLFFTRGVSLRAWDEAGILGREATLYQRLQQRNAEVSFVTYGGRGDQLYTDEIPGIRILSNSLDLPASLYQMKLQLFPPKGTVFKSNQVDGAQIALAAARRSRAAFVARCGYLLSQVQERTHGMDSRAAQAARNLEQQVFTASDQVSVTTQAMSRTIQKNYQVSGDKVSVIPNYVDIDRFRPKLREANKRARIGFVGRLAWEKNLLHLIDAVTGLDVDFVLVGQGPQREELAARAAANGASVSFLGRVPNKHLPGILNTWDAFVLPSFYEGHPKAMLEAMACGLPVIGTRVQGIVELIADGETGLLCETDAGSIRQALERIAGDGALRTKLGQNARRYVEKHFALEKVVDMEMAMLNGLTT